MQQRFIPAKFHGWLDIATSGLWMVGPEMFRLKWVPGSTLPPKLFGAVVLVIALLTDYGKTEGLEYGGLRILSLKQHAVIEVTGAAVVATAPWITGSRKLGVNYWLPHAVVLGTETLFAFCTKIPEDAKR